MELEMELKKTAQETEEEMLAEMLRLVLTPLRDKKGRLEEDSKHAAEAAVAASDEKRKLEAQLVEVKGVNARCVLYIEKYGSPQMNSTLYDEGLMTLSSPDIQEQIRKDAAKAEEAVAKKIATSENEIKRHTALAADLKKSAQSLGELIGKFEGQINDFESSLSDANVCLREMQKAVDEHKSVLNTLRPRSDFKKMCNEVSIFFGRTPITATMKLVQDFMEAATNILSSAPEKKASSKRGLNIN